MIDAGTPFNVIYAENDDMAKGAVAALDKANISHGVGKDVIVMGFDCNKWALEELKAGNWNYDGQCNPFQASYIDDIIKKLESGELHVFDCSTFTVSGANVKDTMKVDADGHLTSYMADVNTDEAYTGDTEVVHDGYFSESEFRSAPYFDLFIDGINPLDTAF